jgi:hypothetical protein
VRMQEHTLETVQGSRSRRHAPTMTIADTAAHPRSLGYL